MYKVNRKLEYALIALKHMYQKHPGELTSAKEICTTYNTPFDATSRVLQIMVQHELLKSEQGPRGGYQIFKNLNQISFLDFLEMITGSVQMATCLHDHKDPCDLANNCNIISPLSKLNELLRDFYQNLSLGEILETPDNGSGLAHAVEQQFMV